MSRVAQFGAAVVVCLMCLLVSAVAVSAQTPPSVRVVTKMAQVLARPASGADVVMTAVAGTILEVLDSDGSWDWVSLPPDPNGTRRRGWIQARDVQAVAADVSAVIRELNQNVEQLQQQVQALQPNGQPRSPAIPPSAADVLRTETDRREVERARREYEAVAQPSGQNVDTAERIGAGRESSGSKGTALLAPGRRVYVRPVPEKDIHEVVGNLLREWGRWSVVDKSEDADIVVRLVLSGSAGWGLASIVATIEDASAGTDIWKSKKQTGTRNVFHGYTSPYNRAAEGILDQMKKASVTWPSKGEKRGAEGQGKGL